MVRRGVPICVRSAGNLLDRYDELLTRELKNVYDFLETRRGRVTGWRMRSPLARLRTVRVEVTQLTEHTTNALKFVGDMFSARLYKL